MGWFYLRDKYQLPLELTAIYVHHGLNSKADDWLTHCEHFCHNWQVSFISEKSTSQWERRGIEQGAREARYRLSPIFTA